MSEIYADGNVGIDTPNPVNNKLEIGTSTGLTVGKQTNYFMMGEVIVHIADDGSILMYGKEDDQYEELLKLINKNDEK